MNEFLVEHDGVRYVLLPPYTPDHDAVLTVVTSCCEASGKGSGDSVTGVVCRGCYRDVDDIYGAVYVHPARPGAEASLARDVGAAAASVVMAAYRTHVAKGSKP